MVETKKELKPQNFKTILKNGNVHDMVWDCMAAKIIEKLVFIDGINNMQ